MTKPRLANPQPTSGTNYDSFSWPRSKTPAKQAIYDRLWDLGWRWDAQSGLWYTPEADVLQGFGRLEWEPDFSEFRIQPPSEIIDGIPHRPPALLRVQMSAHATTT